MSKKYVYLFSEGNANMRELLGGKGANLAEMSNIGLPVPQGFTITTEACTQYYADGRKINDEIMAEIMKNVETMEQINGKKFGDLENPLLVSVRSGARASMPGMMDTILNLGLNDDVVAAMIKGNPDPKFERFVYDSYRRFIQMFSDVVMEVGKKYFEQLIDAMKEAKGVTYDVELTAADLKELAEQFKAEYKKQIGEDFPSAAPGTTPAPMSIAVTTTSPIPGALPSTSCRWSSATSTTIPVPALPSPATPPPVRRSSLVSSSPTPRARMSSPASAPRCPSPRWPRSSPRPLTSS